MEFLIMADIYLYFSSKRKFIVKTDFKNKIYISNDFFFVHVFLAQITLLNQKSNR